MVKHLQLAISTLILFNLSFTISAQKFGFEKLLKENPHQLTTFCVPYNTQNQNLLESEGINIKYSAGNWLFITAAPQWVNEKVGSGELSDFYFEFAPPSLMSDTARAHHFVDDVHAGLGGLNSSYTGKNVIMGYVDTGIEVEHEDFLDSNGNTRVIRYWDQTMPDNASSPQPYGYGYSWDSTQINNGSITSLDLSAHGSSVSGQGSGDGSANGSNKGMAPECTIIAVKTDFTRPNWTLTVADACDYIFKVADTLGLPAVINLSLGSYIGSHDGNDPASLVMESLLDAKPGRIIVCAAGNSGAQNRYHQQGNPTADTNFFHFVNNPFGTAAFGPNSVYFDLWSDTTDALWDFAYGIDHNVGTTWTFKGRTAFHGAMSSLGVTIFDTVWNGANRLATIEVYTEIIGGNFHMQLVAKHDSTGYSYRYRYETTGAGKYDLWSGEWLNYNNMYYGGPPLADFPDSIYFVGPDTNQTIVSSWNCSEKVISVGNMRNRFDHMNNNGVPYVPTDLTPPGKLSPNSSKGPNRHDVIKPDVTAAGDVSLGAGPLWFLMNPANNPQIDSGGMHVRNGGTSMAAPVVAGIAALYLERCGKATYQDFKNDLIATSFADQFTGVTPNNAYGNGKPHALNALLQVSPPNQPTITIDVNTDLISSIENSYEWFLNGAILSGETNQTLVISPPYGSYQVMTTNAQGCTAFSDPFVVTLKVEDIIQNKHLTFPNPTRSVISITNETEISNVSLISSKGKKMKLIKLSSGTYSLEECPSGNYILTIESQNGTFYSKIIKL